MNTDQRRFEGKHSEISDRVLRCFYDVYNELGTGFLESVYDAALVVALRQSGLNVANQVPVPVYYRGQAIADFRPDLIVEGKVLLELKVVQALDRSHFVMLMATK